MMFLVQYLSNPKEIPIYGASSPASHPRNLFRDDVSFSKSRSHVKFVSSLPSTLFMPSCSATIVAYTDQVTTSRHWLSPSRTAGANHSREMSSPARNKLFLKTFWRSSGVPLDK